MYQPANDSSTTYKYPSRYQARIRRRSNVKFIFVTLSLFFSIIILTSYYSSTTDDVINSLLQFHASIFGVDYGEESEGEHELDPTKYHGRYPHSLLTLFYPYTMFRDIVLEQPINVTDIPFFWHLHNSDEKIFKQVLTKCYGLQLIELNSKEEIQKAIDVELVNGLQRDTHVITSPFIRETAEVFSMDHFGRMMCFFRHPLDYDIHPAIPKYEKNDNWLTRLITDEHDKDITFWELAIAKQVVRQTCLVGTLDKMKISMIRFQEHFGWKYVNGMSKEEGEQCVDAAIKGNLPEETWIDHESDEFKSFYKSNLMDCQLYELAQSAWRHQIQTIIPWELQLSRDEDDDEDEEEEED